MPEKRHRAPFKELNLNIAEPITLSCLFAPMGYFWIAAGLIFLIKLGQQNCILK